MLATVATFTEPWEAHLFCSRLRAESLFAVVSHEHHVGLNWSEALAFGGIRVQVHRMDRDKALEIYRQCRSGEIQAELATRFGGFAAPQCPACQATAITHRRSLPMLALLAASAYFIGLVFPLRSSVHRCRVCGAKWSDGETEQSGSAI